MDGNERSRGGCLDLKITMLMQSAHGLLKYDVLLITGDVDARKQRRRVATGSAVLWKTNHLNEERVVAGSPASMSSNRRPPISLLGARIPIGFAVCESIVERG
jgi:hypothetical protein